MKGDVAFNSYCVGLFGSEAAGLTVLQSVSAGSGTLKAVLQSGRRQGDASHLGRFFENNELARRGNLDDSRIRRQRRQMSSTLRYAARHLSEVPSAELAL